MRLFGLPKPTLPENYPGLFDPAILSIFSKTYDPPTTNLSGPDRWRYSSLAQMEEYQNDFSPNSVVRDSFMKAGAQIYPPNRL